MVFEAMSRKVIRDFIRQADSLDSSQATAYFETIMEVYEDSVHTAAERVATLEGDTLWLLAEYRKNVEAKDNSPEEKQKHRIAQSNLWQLLSVLITSTADKGIYLSEAFIKKYDNVEFVCSEFGEYVRDTYNVRGWKAPEPQHEAPEGANGESGEIQGNENKKTSEAKETPRKSQTWDELTDDERWLFYCENYYNKFIDECAKNKPDTQGVVKLYKRIIIIKEDNEVVNLKVRLTNKWKSKKLFHTCLQKWKIVKVGYPQLVKVINNLL